MKKDISPLLEQLKESSNDFHPLQKQIIKNALRNVEQAFISGSEFTSSDDTKLLLWELSIASAKKEILGFATNRKTLSGFGFSQNQNRIDIQASIAAKGVKIHRIFAVNQSDYEQFHFMELIRAQLKAGIDVLIAYANTAEYINSELENEQENYVLIDDTLLYRSFVVGSESRNSITFDKEKIKKYRTMFDELRSKSHQFTVKDLPKSFNDL